MQLRPVNLPVEDSQLLTQRDILCGERCPGQDQASYEQKESGDEGHKYAGAAVRLIFQVYVGRRREERLNDCHFRA